MAKHRAHACGQNQFLPSQGNLRTYVRTRVAPRSNSIRPRQTPVMHKVLGTLDRCVRVVTWQPASYSDRASARTYARACLIFQRRDGCKTSKPRRDETPANTRNETVCTSAGLRHYSTGKTPTGPRSKQVREANTTNKRPRPSHHNRAGGPRRGCTLDHSLAERIARSV